MSTLDLPTLSLAVGRARMVSLVDIVYYYPRSPTSAPKVCQITYEIHTWSVAIGVGAGEALLSLRTWAVWGSSRKMGAFLGILWIITWSSAFALVVMFLQKIQLMLVLMAIPAYRTFQELGRDRTLTKIVYQDGMHEIKFVFVLLDNVPAGLIYYSYLFVISLINIIVILNTPPDLVTLLSTYVSRSLDILLRLQLTSQSPVAYLKGWNEPFTPY
ncbi:hypothetical protein NLJ89_g9186 [Agrocybe chaxingu]|uniref:Uncharacterized protein n=1 Tax=Agrocybe chaxingu TaxID=84603 RepID=A0A9W8JTU3_9AGAR|nr:hypothetical protein NLJ89_g9186 [Agrocybe chaxingu]